MKKTTLKSWSLPLIAGLLWLATAGARAEDVEQVRADPTVRYSMDSLLRLGILAGLFTPERIGPDSRPLLVHRASQESGGFGEFANLRRVLPVYLVLSWAGDGHPMDSWLGSANRWSNRSLRALALSVPERSVFTVDPVDDDPRFDYLHQVDPGTGGQAFLATVPLLTAAQLTDNGLVRYSLYLGSIVPGITRLDGEGRDLSHAVIGWSLALLATDAVARNADSGELTFSPVLMPNGIAGVQLARRF